jgi:hypothetical protein
VKARHRNVVFAISTGDFAALIDRAVTTRLARIADSAKNEYCQAVHNKSTRGLFEANWTVLKEPPGHVRQSLSWTVLRDSSEGSPPRIWHPGVPQAEAYAPSLLTLVRSPTWTSTKTACSRRKTGTARRRSLGSSRLSHSGSSCRRTWRGPSRCAGRPSTSESAAATNAGIDYLAMWQEVLGPLVGPYNVLSEDGLPIGVVNDGQLEHCSSL